MKIVVCVKQVNGEINPFDACAVECALRIENADVTVISMGKPQVSDMLKALTRLGVNRAILLTDTAFAGSDTLATSYVLSLAIEKLSPDLIICGRQSIDGDTAQVGPCLSQMLGYSLITNVLNIHKADSAEILCSSRIREACVKLPALITVERINTLRFPSIRSRAKEVEVWNAKDINADIDRCGLKGSPTKVLKTYECNTGLRKCKFIRPEELMTVIEHSKNKSRTKIQMEQSFEKFEEVWAVGDELKEVALSIASEVKIIEKLPPDKIAELAKLHKPKVILWNSDLWGRSNAPRVASILNTGLCADCTALETDGEKLYMYRPAFGGNIMAKIECRTYPQMATVRVTENAMNEVIVAGGKGAKDSFELLKTFAERIGAQIGASRGLVDMGIAPYEAQIGLTGKNVNPLLYIAFGISGAVQHTCSIEQAGTIIAVNTDRNARIFEYADFGIVEDVKNVLNAKTIGLV